VVQARLVEKGLSEAGRMRSLRRLFTLDMSESTRGSPRQHGSIVVDVDHSLGKSLRGFLRQIVPDSSLDEPVRILA
jgi:hypothetical protein